MANCVYHVLQRCCHYANYIATVKTLLTKQAKIPRVITVLGCRLFSNDKNSEKSGKLIQLVVTSLRVDRVAASGLGLARRKIDHSLLAGNIFLNGEKVTKKSQQVAEGDMITRVSETQSKQEEINFGQVEVVCIGVRTKKGNYHVELLRNKFLSLPIQEFWNKHKNRN